MTSDDQLLREHIELWMAGWTSMVFTVHPSGRRVLLWKERGGQHFTYETEAAIQMLRQG